MTDAELLTLLVRALDRSGEQSLAELSKSVALLDDAPLEPTRIAKVLGMNLEQFTRVPRRGAASAWRLTEHMHGPPPRQYQPSTRSNASRASHVAEPTGLRASVPYGDAGERPPAHVPPLANSPSHTSKPEKLAIRKRKPALGGDASDPAVVSPLLPALLAKLSLHPWQLDALAAWQEAGRKGIVEAVTGAGKTRLAIAAAAEALLDPAARVWILVPTLALAAQWKDALRSVARDIPLVAGARVHILGSEDDSVMDGARIWIATMQFAYTRILLKHPGPSLLIGDEVHRLGAPAWSASLDKAFHRRLGLTATLERDDDGVESLLMPYFERVVYQLDLPKALRDGIVAPFNVVFVAVHFTEQEQEGYTEASELLRSAMSQIRASGLVSMSPFGAFMREVQLHANNPNSRICGAARSFLKAFADRRELVASASNKMQRVAELAPYLRNHGRTLMFCETVRSMEQSATILKAACLSIDCIDGSNTTDERDSRIDRMRKGKVQVLLAPKILDEGIDVPGADTGVIVAASSSRRQLIQRLGRVIRLKPDWRVATVFVLYVAGTPEDPDQSDRMETLSLLLDNAQSVRKVGANTRIDASRIY